MSYRTYIQRAYELTRTNPLLWLFGLLSSSASVLGFLVWFFVLRQGRASWTDSFQSLHIPVWVIVCCLLALSVLAVVGRYAKTILLLHICSQLRIKRVPAGFKRANDAVVVQPEDEALAGVVRQSLIRESRDLSVSVIAIHTVVSLLLLVALVAVLYPLLFMNEDSLQVKLIATSVIGVLLLAVLILFQGAFATLFAVLYHRSVTVAMNIAGDMLVMHVQKILLIGFLVIGSLGISGVVLYGALTGLEQVANQSFSFVTVSIGALLWVGMVNVFMTSVIAQLFSDIVKPEAFDQTAPSITEASSPEL